MITDESKHATGDVALFTKLFVAQHHPKNACHAAEGEVLIVKPRKPFPAKEKTHRFVSAADV